MNINEVKNIGRGAFSKLKQIATPEISKRKKTWKKPLQINKWDFELHAQFQINKTLSTARKELYEKEILEIDEWVLDLLKEFKINQNQLGNKVTHLSLIPPELESAALSTEIEISLRRLQKLVPELKIFLNDYSEVISSIEKNDWHRSIKLIKDINEKNGYSYWAIETELAITQVLSGIENAKSLISKMTIGASALTKFFLYYFGVRNEPAQTTSRFKINLKRRIEDSELNLAAQDYSKYRLYGQFDSNEIYLSNVLACEQLNTSIDLLFTIIKIVNFITRNENLFTPIAVNKVREAKEFLILLIKKSEIPNLMVEEGDDYKKSLVELASFGLSKAWSLHATDKFRTASDKIIKMGISSKLSTRSDGVEAEEFEKFLSNFNTLPIAMYLGDITEIKQIPEYVIDSIQNSPLEERIDTINKALINTVISILSKSIPLHLNELELLLSSTNCTDTQEAQEIRNKTQSDFYKDHGVLKDTINIVLAHSLFRGGYIKECISICSELSIENPTLISMLPLDNLFLGVRWPTLSVMEPSMDLCIALDNYLQISGERKIRTFKRYSVKALMDQYGSSDVLDLLSKLKASNVNLLKLEFFANYVCDTVTLELLPGGENTKKMMLQRKNILNFLASLDTQDKLNYLYEESVIEDRLEVDDGMYVLDDSKVFVDEQPILSIINKDMAADFQRYLKLAESSENSPDSMADVLKSINTLSAQIFQIPKNDADDLLAQILHSMLDKFLFDSASGLDIIIGRRIRHGTIQGEIRGYLEKVGLIGIKSHAGANYDHAPKVQTLSHKLDPKKRKAVNAAFTRFYESIDQLIVLLRDNYFHVHSKSHPRGVFELNINTIMFPLARSLAQTSPSIDSFSKQCFELFWFFLTGPVDVVRPKIETEIKKTFSNIFTKLFNQLRSLNISDPEFYANLQQASEELQRRASSISSWIRVPQSTVEGGTYSIGRVIDIASAKVSSQRLGFRPSIKSIFPEDLELDVHGFSIVFDALYIAIDNVCQHSGKKIDNQIKIEIRLSEDKTLLSFIISNEVAPNSGVAEKEIKLQNLRSTIQKKAYGERARLDRGSGLAKLAAIVMQTEKTKISFGYQNSSQFQLKFDLIYVSGNTEPKSLPKSGLSFGNLGTEVAD